MSTSEARQRQDRSFVLHVDAPDRPARLVVQDVGSEAPSAPRPLTPETHYVDSFAWSPDGRELAYSAAPRSGFDAPMRRASMPSTRAAVGHAPSSTETG
ncbi:MAG: hypothetical protein U0Q12_02840 [Vicinamibacterales bacterium]